MEYQDNDNYGKPKSAYLKKIAAMSDEDLLRETEDKIWLSAYASNNPRSDYHWHVDALYDEWKRRGKEYQYAVAYDAARKSCGC